ncbi:MAG: hypothetical protein M0Z56_12155 [Desulfobacteraceae bacterium]|nr:hypothetical protein [Desulfobacteraceae bacterium]
MTFIKKAAHFVLFLGLILLFTTGAWAENHHPETTRLNSFKFKENDFENSVCFRRCHQPDDFKPSDKTEQQWRMLIEKNGHDIFKKIIWEFPGQKEQTLRYLIEHAGDSGNEGIGVWH